MFSTSVYCDLTQSGLHYIYRCYIIPYTEQATHYKQKVPKVMVLFIIVGYIIWYDDKISVGAYHILTINLMFTFLVLLFHWCSAQ